MSENEGLMAPAPKGSVSMLVMSIVWLGAVGAGLAMVMKYESAPGTTGETPVIWPTGATIDRDAHRPTLIMFAHPQCPCTRASMNELNRLLAKCSDGVAAHVFFLKPEEWGDDWTQSDLWRSAASLPGVVLHEDDGGREAARFGAETSGQVMLYHPRGPLLFQGGITAARGHAGDNAGAARIFALVTGSDSGPALSTTPVFGCALRELPEDSAD